MLPVQGTPWRQVSENKKVQPVKLWLKIIPPALKSIQARCVDPRVRIPESVTNSCHKVHPTTFESVHRNEYWRHTLLPVKGFRTLHFTPNTLSLIFQLYKLCECMQLISFDLGGKMNAEWIESWEDLPLDSPPFSGLEEGKASSRGQES